MARGDTAPCPDDDDDDVRVARATRASRSVLLCSIASNSSAMAISLKNPPSASLLTVELTVLEVASSDHALVHPRQGTQEQQPTSVNLPRCKTTKRSKKVKKGSDRCSSYPHTGASVEENITQKWARCQAEVERRGFAAAQVEALN